MWTPLYRSSTKQGASIVNSGIKNPETHAHLCHSMKNGKVSKESYEKCNRSCGCKLWGSAITQSKNKSKSIYNIHTIASKPAKFQKNPTKNVARNADKTLQMEILSQKGMLLCQKLSDQKSQTTCTFSDHSKKTCTFSKESDKRCKSCGHKLWKWKF